MDLCMSEEGGGEGEGAGGLNNFSQQPIFASTLLGAIPACTHLRLDWKAPWQPPGVRGRGERLLLSANEVGTWGSVSLRLCLSASPLRRRRRWGGGGSGGYECLPSDTNAIFTHLHPGPPSSAVQVRGMGGAARIRFCPVGKITNGSEIAVPQSGSSLSGKCSHAN